MDAATAGLIGAVLGGGVALVTSLIDGWNSRKLEAAKAQWGQEHAVGAELRGHVGAVARHLLSCQHSMEWLCALTDDGGVLTQKSVETYHREIHATFPKLLGGLATVSSLDSRLYAELERLAEEVFRIDGKIADALKKFDRAPAEASREVSTQRIDATELYRKLPREIGEIMKGVA